MSATRKQTQLTYKEGYIAGQIDAENGDDGAYRFDKGMLQGEQWYLGYMDGKNDYKAGDRL